MKILHTSDWHLGRGLHGFMLYEAQELAVNHILDVAIKEQVAAFIIAGDVFDRQIPPTDSIKLLNSALTRLDEAGIAVIVTAGNHDGADRIAANSNLLKTNVRIAGAVRDISDPVILKDEFGDVLIYPITYLHPEVAVTTLATENDEPIARSHEAVMGAAIARMNADKAARETKAGKKLRNIAVAHAFVGTYGSSSKRNEEGDSIQEAGLEVSESERDISIGGVQVIPADLFAGITYVALGHLHRPQEVKPKASKEITLRYSGSLLRYSMSERNHQKSFVIIDLDESTELTPERISLHPIPQPCGMARLSDTVDELVSGKYEKNKEDFVEVIVTDETYPDSMYPRIKNYFPNLIGLTRAPGGRVGTAKKQENVDARNLDPIDVMGAFFSRATGKELGAEELRVLQEVFEKSRNELDARS